MIRKLHLITAVLILGIAMTFWGWLNEFYGESARIHAMLERKMPYVSIQYIQNPLTDGWLDKFNNFSPWDLILRTSFLRPNLMATGIRPVSIDGFEKMRRDQQDIVLERLELQKSGLPYRSLMRGLRDLHGFSGSIERRLDIPMLLDPLAKEYTIHFRDWFVKSGSQVGISFSFKPEEPTFWLQRKNEMDRGVLPLHLRVFMPILDLSFVLQLLDGAPQPGLQALQQREGYVPKSLDEYQRLIASMFMEGRQRLDIRAVFLNGLLFPDYHIEAANRTIAESAFRKGAGASPAEKRAFREYMLAWLYRELGERKLALIFYTDLQQVSMQFRQQYNPVHLLPFLQRRENYSTVTSLLYTTQDYDEELIEVARNVPAASFYMFWVPTNDTEVFRRNFRKAVNSLPSSKILYAGGTINPEQAYGAARIAKEILTDILTEQILNGTYTMGDALQLAARFFMGNATAIYQFRPGLDMDDANAPAQQ